ncbi:MAG: flagellar protein FlgN [Lachnospira sp.]
MASLIDSLIEALNKEKTEYDKLLELSNSKTSAIVSGDVEQLQEILVKEQKLIDNLDSIEKVRQDTVKDICNVLHLDYREIKVEQIVQLLEKKAAEHDALQDAQLNLRRTIDQLVKVNDNNKILLQQSMDMIEFELNLAKNSMVAPQTGNYGKSAYEETGTLGRGSFDAKQ